MSCQRQENDMILVLLSTYRLDNDDSDDVFSSFNVILFLNYLSNWKLFYFYLWFDFLVRRCCTKTTVKRGRITKLFNASTENLKK